MAARAQVPDLGLSDRRRLQTPVMGGPGSHRRESASILFAHRRLVAPRHPLRGQRHVAALPHRDRRAARHSRPCLGPLPHHEEHEPGSRPSPSRRGGPACARRLRAGAETFPLVPVEAPREPDRQTDGETR